ncbi:MAG: Mrp/NBP35 family ATP-binding protein [Verrucomicrobiales bacterium]|jgi:ATP-binding protein involved in chromosome partitioning|nr:Mrp/NBP35 family ATP-binding protein [Verrucomicrobiales bacterium]
MVNHTLTMAGYNERTRGFVSIIIGWLKTGGTLTLTHVMTREQIIEALRQVKYPGFSRDIVSFGLVTGVEFTAPGTIVSLTVTTTDERVPRILQEQVAEVVGRLPGISRPVDVRVKINTSPSAANELPPREGIAGVRRIIAVASGKGGVGKSTVAANLAAAFHLLGMKVGLCDCDLHGPSLALMFGAGEQPTMDEDDLINPVTVSGIKLMSMGLLVDDDAPVILRGPMVTRYTQQFLRGVRWGELDALVLDLPPGTGDIALTVTQTLALDGAVIVSTPQEVALIDARKAVKMFAKVGVPVLGLIENMSYFTAPDSGRRYDIFGTGGARVEAEKLGVPLLAEVPIEMATREAGDRGRPIVLRDAGTPAARALLAAAEKIRGLL